MFCRKEEIWRRMQLAWLNRGAHLKWLVFALVAVCSIVFLPLLYASFFNPNSGILPSAHSAKASKSNWLVDLLYNVLTYASVLLPVWLLGRWLKSIHYFHAKKEETICHAFLRRFYIGVMTDSDSSADSTTPSLLPPSRNSPLPHMNDNSVLALCALGLLLSYLTWGVLQERVMTQTYEGEHFHDSQFLVFVNRILGGVVALLIVLLAPMLGVIKPANHKAPLFEFVYSSLSNILSSWFQYEALKFVSFPTQVLAKACKIIPVMLMGRLISRKSYQLHEYGTAGLISVGVALFLLASSSPIASSRAHATSGLTSMAVTTLSGVFLLMGYMITDSFTSNWQDKLFKQFTVSSLQMMAYTNLWSCLLTVTSLCEKNSLLTAMQFSAEHPRFLWDIVLLSISSAVGQLFIFYTIARFGAVTFIIIMTVRQAVAILLSCILYQHPISLLGGVGIFIVFAALFLRIFISYRSRRHHYVDSNETKITTPTTTTNSAIHNINNNSHLLTKPSHNNSECCAMLLPASDDPAVSSSSLHVVHIDSHHAYSPKVVNQSSLPPMHYY